MKRTTLSFILYVLVLASSMAQTYSGKDNGMNINASKHYEFIQEQVHVMTDRELYMPSDTIWFNAWIVKADTKQKMQLSNYLYVELRDAGGYLKERVRLRTASPGIFSGYLPLSEKLKSNTYTLVAYTYHMLCTDETLFFKKPIDILTPTDMSNGITVRSLRDRKEIKDFQPVRSNSNVVVDFDIPQRGQYAASVTNVSMNPSDPESFITNTIPYMPLLYQRGNVPDSVLHFPYEQGSVVSGTVYGNFFSKKPQANIDVSIVGLSERYADNTITDERGHFLFNIPDIYLDSGTAGYMVQAKTKRAHTIKHNITFDRTPFPETLKTFVPKKNRFVHLSKKETAENEEMFQWAEDGRYHKTIMLGEVTVEGHAQTSRTHNDFADKSICISNHNGMKINSFRELAALLGLQIRYDKQGAEHFVDPHDMSMSINSKAEDPIIDVYVDNIQLPDYDISQLEGLFPMDCIMRVDKLSASQAMTMPGRGFKSSTVINIIMKTPEEIAKTVSSFADFSIAKQMACQTVAEFKTNETSYAPPVIYWNPSVTAIQDNKASVAFKTPDATSSIYRVTLEGMTDNGTPVHEEKYIQIAEQAGL